MHDIIIDEKVIMMWRNHKEEVLLDMVIYRPKILSKEAYHATLQRHNASRVSYF